jgi:hypothetical protein
VAEERVAVKEVGVSAGLGGRTCNRNEAWGCR